jgi:aspartyl-tRNA(Asn)/glutamyl-tRNA(Gln) amidotransferase subunit B
MAELTDKYEAVIGLEVHVQLSTRSKVFCTDPAGFNQEPNSQTSIISLGHPGTLPMFNSTVLEHALKLGLALNCSIASPFCFARKNYFYTDLPKGYQITQDRTPVCIGGQVPVRDEKGQISNIRLHHIHIEEDAGKSIHDQDPEYSFIDLNRAGVPLLEIVSEPDLRSGQEAMNYLAEIRRLVRYLEICDGNMEEGSLRCDANVSIRLMGETRLGTRTEIKNLNSLNFVRRAIEKEISRQISLVEQGEKIIQQTLSFNPSSGESVPIRSKEDAHDYRYFPEPDLAPVFVPEAMVLQMQAILPPLPWEFFHRFTSEYELSAYDAAILCESPDLAGYYDSLARLVPHRKTAANFLIGPIKALLAEKKISFSDLPLAPSTLAELISLIESGKISFTVASQKLLPLLFDNPTSQAEDLAGKYNLFQASDEDYLLKIIDELLRSFPEKADEYRKGKKGLIGFFMGEVMKRSGGKADPARCQVLLKETLDRKN